MTREQPEPSISSRVTRAFMWTLVLVAASAILTTASFVVDLFVFDPRSAALQEARRGARTSHEGMLDEETALRAWLVMRDPKYLHPMRNAQQEIEEGHAVLDETVGADRDFAPLLLETRLAEQAWQTAWADVAQAVLPGDPPTAEPFFAGGKALFDAYRGRESRLTGALRAASDATDRAQGRMLGAAALVQLTLFVVLGLFARSQRRLIRNTLEHPLHALLAAVSRVRDGDLTTAIPVDGPSELRQIGADLGHMTRALAAAAAESARLHQVAVERSHIDGLTRLLNRHRLDEDLAAECRRSARYGRPLSVIMMDVDHFKTFNDAHGHPAGDLVLQNVAEVLRLNVRATDSAYRYGGEEFLVVLRETDEAGAGMLAERLRAAMERTLARQPAGRGVTASFGVAQYGESRALPGPLVEAADRALYRAKHAGRNRVVVASAA
jgi:diguanylate cyclase (GGDEF)-like protein